MIYMITKDRLGRRLFTPIQVGRRDCQGMVRWAMGPGEKCVRRKPVRHIQTARQARP